jgi:glycosyltransferase involved in cell wall biosynthesis
MDARRRIAFLVGAFPHVSETFIWREALSFLRSGAASLMALESNLYREEMFPADVGEAVGAMDFRTFSFAQVLAVIVQALMHPLAVLRACILMRPYYGWRRRLSLIYSLMRLRRLIARDRCSRVHAHWRSPTDVAYLNHLLFGEPFSIFLHAHDIYDEGLGDARYRPLFGAKIKAAETVFTCTRNNQRTLSELYPAANVVLAYHGIDDRLIEMPRQQEAGPVRLISVGRIIAYKGFDLVPALAERLSGMGVDYRWTIIGDGSLLDWLRGEIAARGLEDKVQITGMLANSAVIEHLLQSDAFVFLGNQEKGQYGLPNVLIEAAGCGLPVVTRPLDTIGELVRDGETGFVEDDIARIAVRIAELGADRGRLARMGQAARHAVTTEHLHGPNIAAMLRRLGIEVAGVKAAAAPEAR